VDAGSAEIAVEMRFRSTAAIIGAQRSSYDKERYVTRGKPLFNFNKIAVLFAFARQCYYLTRH
jgi:hypothetical protein